MAAIDLRLCRDQIDHHRRDATADDVGHGRRDALVGNVLKRDVSHETEQLHRHVGLAADAGGSVTEFSLLGFGGGEEVLDRFDRKGGLTSRTLGELINWLIGAKSRKISYFTLLLVEGTMVIVAWRLRGPPETRRDKIQRAATFAENGVCLAAGDRHVPFDWRRLAQPHY